MFVILFCHFDILLCYIDVINFFERRRKNRKPSADCTTQVECSFFRRSELNDAGADYSGLIISKYIKYLITVIKCYFFPVFFVHWLKVIEGSEPCETFT